MDVKTNMTPVRKEMLFVVFYGGGEGNCIADN